MESDLERISPVECRVRVQIPWKDVSSRVDGKLRDLRKQVRMPGFRPGKVPPQVIERLYGKSVRDEVARDLVQETFQTVVVQHETTPLTQPVLESSNMEKGQAFKYAARFEVAPLIEPADYEGIAVRRRPAAVEDGKVDEALEQKQAELTELHPIEEGEREATQAGDIWTVDVEGTFGEQDISRKDVRIEIGNEEREYLPGLGSELQELELTAVGSTRELEFTPPEDRVPDAFKGKKATIKLGFREVQKKFVPELDDEFARDTGDGETLDELKKNIHDGLLETDQAEAERAARRRLVESLLERNEFEPAPSMVSREVAAQVDAFKRQLAQQALSLSQVGTTEGQLAERMRPQALFNVKAFLLLDAIGKTEDIDVSDEDLDEEVKRMAEDQGQNPARLRATMEKNQQLILLKAQMREERILDFLMDKAEVTEAPDPDPNEEQDPEEAVKEAEAKLKEKTGKKKKSTKKKSTKKKTEKKSAKADTADEEPKAKKTAKKKAAKKSSKKSK
jgi:trigger factor